MFPVANTGAVNDIIPCNEENDFCHTIEINGIQGFILQIQDILNSILPVLIALAVVYFVWGVVLYVIGDAEEAKKKGKDRIIYGIIGLAVIVSLWGLVYIVVDTFGLDSVAPELSPDPASCSFIGNPNPYLRD